MEWLGYDEHTLVEKARFPVRVLETEQDVFEQCARDMLETIEANNGCGKNTVLVLPFGPEGQYPIFAQEVNRRGLSLKDTTFAFMDAYLLDGEDLPYEHTRSVARRAQAQVFGPIREELRPPQENCLYPAARSVPWLYQRITELGGIDLCVAGIGINGHIGFNEPVHASPREYLAQAGSRILELSAETRLICAINNYGGAVSAIPRFGITLGLREMMQARKMRVYCFRSWHNACIKRAACEALSGDFPASLLQLHPDMRLYCHRAITTPIRV